MTSTKTAPCPTCRRPADLSRENPDRPFCSTRCRELDLARWLDEDYRIPGPPAEPDLSRPGEEPES